MLHYLFRTFSCRRKNKFPNSVGVVIHNVVKIIKKVNIVTDDLLRKCAKSKATGTNRRLFTKPG